MVSNLFFYQLMLIALVWLCLMLLGLWPSELAAERLPTAPPIPPSRKRSKVPKAFPGLTRNPHCDTGRQDVTLHREPPCAPPPRLISTRGRRRQVDTSHHFCPDPDCRYGGWTGLGNISANGHPSGGPWRQFHCSRCGGYLLATQGTPLHGKRVSPDTLVEAAEHLAAFSRHFLYDVHVDQIQLDELFALLSAVKDGAVSEAEALKRLSRSPHWVWTAMDPVTKLLLTIDIGDRTLAMAQSVVHQVGQVLAPGCVPL